MLIFVRVVVQQLRLGLFWRFLSVTFGALLYQLKLKLLALVC